MVDVGIFLLKTGMAARDRPLGFVPNKFQPSIPHNSKSSGISFLLKMKKIPKSSSSGDVIISGDVRPVGPPPPPPPPPPVPIPPPGVPFGLVIDPPGLPSATVLFSSAV